MRRAAAARRCGREGRGLRSTVVDWWCRVRPCVGEETAGESPSLGRGAGLRACGGQGEEEWCRVAGIG